MDLRQLKYFQLASQLNSISKAADQLHIAQPSVSIAIQKLEEELGVQLFNRSQRQITLNAEGRVFSKRVNDILASIDDSIREMKDLSKSPHGTINIGVPSMIGLSLFPHIFAQFQKQYPRFSLTAIEAGSVTIRNLVEQGHIDVGFITQSAAPSPAIIKAASPSALDTIPITTGQIYLCLYPGHPLTHLANIPFEQLSGQSFILLRKDTFNRQAILAECKKHHFTPQIIFSSSQVETIISLVELEIGITFLFDAIAKRYPAIQSFPLADPIYYQIALTWNRNRYLSNAAKTFVEFMSGVHFSV
ncbi:LysR family transcriptional regulator [Acetonema longum]|uniref:LysR family transcriptional regulator n=1 Tax=Acetonema longum DSM 6540 TaxID=1009370 RepID=F7NNN2_9FIRM|nr:LysR family transcriptional regulator [Acetonema longum]EGO62352.1 LysR family transcriptional regulator [Acetonema longum DSM 6540]